MALAYEGDTGGVCQHPGCTEFDFLLSFCHGCGGSYCAAHTAALAHECPAGTAPDGDRSREEQSSEPTMVVVLPKCTFCDTKALTVSHCGECGVLVCLEHRYHTQHAQLPGAAPATSSFGQLRPSAATTTATGRTFGAKTTNSSTLTGDGANSGGLPPQPQAGKTSATPLLVGRSTHRATGPDDAPLRVTALFLASIPHTEPNPSSSANGHSTTTTAAATGASNTGIAQAPPPPAATTSLFGGVKPSAAPSSAPSAFSAVKPTSSPGGPQAVASGDDSSGGETSSEKWFLSVARNRAVGAAMDSFAAALRSCGRLSSADRTVHVWLVERPPKSSDDDGKVQFSSSPAARLSIRPVTLASQSQVELYHGAVLVAVGQAAGDAAPSLDAVTAAVRKHNVILHAAPQPATASASANHAIGVDGVEGKQDIRAEPPAESDGAEAPKSTPADSLPTFDDSTDPLSVILTNTPFANSKLKPLKPPGPPPPAPTAVVAVFPLVAGLPPKQRRPFVATVSLSWSPGRMLDALCTAAEFPNSNHRTANAEEKLTIVDLRAMVPLTDGQGLENAATLGIVKGGALPASVVSVLREWRGQCDAKGSPPKPLKLRMMKECVIM